MGKSKLGKSLNLQKNLVKTVVVEVAEIYYRKSKLGKSLNLQKKEKGVHQDLLPRKYSVCKKKWHLHKKNERKKQPERLVKGLKKKKDWKRKNQVDLLHHLAWVLLPLHHLAWVLLPLHHLAWVLLLLHHLAWVLHLLH